MMADVLVCSVVMLPLKFINSTTVIDNGWLAVSNVLTCTIDAAAAAG